MRLGRSLTLPTRFPGSRKAIWILNCPTSCWSWLAIAARRSAAAFTCWALVVFSRVAWLTPWMLLEMSPTALAASLALRDMSLAAVAASPAFRDMSLAPLATSEIERAMCSTPWLASPRLSALTLAEALCFSTASEIRTDEAFSL